MLTRDMIHVLKFVSFMVTTTGARVKAINICSKLIKLRSTDFVWRIFCHGNKSFNKYGESKIKDNTLITLVS